MDEIVRAGMAGLKGPAQALTLARRMTGAMRASLQEQWDAAQEFEPTLIVGRRSGVVGSTSSVSARGRCRCAARPPTPSQPASSTW